MKRVYQTKFGEGGNCLPACVATLFELSLDQVPDFGHDRRWFHRLGVWLNERGFGVAISKVQDCGVLMEGLCICSVETTRTTSTRLHAIVASLAVTDDGIEISRIHDPDPLPAEIVRIVDVLVIVRPFSDA